MAFYRLFKGVDQNLAMLVVIFGGVMPALTDFIGVVSDAGVLNLRANCCSRPVVVGARVTGAFRRVLARLSAGPLVPGAIASARTGAPRP
jgi:hypothetical protein